MTSSVPRVISIDDLKWRAAEVLRLALETRNPYYVEMALPVVSSVIEELKVLANEGKYDTAYVDKLVKKFEGTKVNIENFVASARAKQNVQD